jgi:manganese/iron transport system ATP-binding protein
MLQFLRCNFRCNDDGPIRASLLHRFQLERILLRMLTQQAPNPIQISRAAPLLDVCDLTVRYGETSALEHANLSLHAGEFIAVIGPNGAGKSTLLKAALGLVAVTSGEIRFSSHLGPRPTQAISYVPQQQSLDWSFPVTVRDVVMMGRTGRIGWLKYPGLTDRKIVQESLEKADIVNLASRPVAALSGGQKQRVLLARMLARESQILLLDEPLTGVDAVTQTAIFELLEHERQAGKALIMVTHDLENAAKWCSSLLLVNRLVIAAGSPELVYTPQNIEATFSSSHLNHVHA